MTLASLGMDKEVVQPGFSPPVTIQGKMYHSIGSLLPAANTELKFAQIYFTHSEQEAASRLGYNRGHTEDFPPTGTPASLSNLVIEVC